MTATRTLIHNFKPGDLLYGLQDQRKSMQKQLQAVSDGHPIIPDKFNTIIISGITNTDTEMYDEKNENDFVCGLKEEKSYNDISTNLILDYLEKLKPDACSKVSVTNNFFPKNEKKLNVEQRRLRRACKAALLDSSITIHFLLNDINLQHAFDRIYSIRHSKNLDLPDINGVLYNSYTAAELHFIFKRYDLIKDHIKFYTKQKDDYIETDLFAWLDLQSYQSKQAIVTWSKTREHKINSEILEYIHKLQKQLQHSEPPAESKSEKVELLAKTPPPSPYPKSQSGSPASQSPLLRLCLTGAGSPPESPDTVLHKKNRPPSGSFSLGVSALESKGLSRG